MSARDLIGIVLVIIGVTVAPLGYRWLGASWMWAGALVGALGFVLVLNAAREGEFLKEWRRGRGGDAGDRNYLGGTTSASFESSDRAGEGGGGGDG